MFQLYQLLTNPRYIPATFIACLVHDVVYRGTEAKLLPPLIYHHVDLHLFWSHLDFVPDKSAPLGVISTPVVFHKPDPT